MDHNYQSSSEGPFIENVFMMDENGEICTVDLLGDHGGEVVVKQEDRDHGGEVVIKQEDLEDEIPAGTYVQTLADGTTIQFIHMDGAKRSTDSPCATASTSQLSLADSGYFGSSINRGSSLGDSQLMDASDIITPPSTVDRLDLGKRLDLNSPMSTMANCRGPQATSTPETPDYVKMETQETAQGLTVKKSAGLPRPMIIPGSSAYNGHPHPGLPNEGYTPTRETVIEITKIETPGEGYFSRENLQGSRGTNRVNCNLQSSRMRQVRRMAQLHQLESTPPAQRGEVPSHQRERTPSPPPRFDLDADIEAGNIDMNTPPQAQTSTAISFNFPRSATSSTTTLTNRRKSSHPLQKMVFNIGKPISKPTTLQSGYKTACTCTVPTISGTSLFSTVKSEPQISINSQQPKKIHTIFPSMCKPSTITSSSMYMTSRTNTPTPDLVVSGISSASQETKGNLKLKCMPSTKSKKKDGLFQKKCEDSDWKPI